MLCLHTKKAPTSCKEISKTLGVSVNNIRAAMSHYTKFKMKYFKRIKSYKQFGDRANRYVLTSHGRKILMTYVTRIKEGREIKVNVENAAALPRRREVIQKEIAEKKKQIAMHHHGIYTANRKTDLDSLVKSLTRAELLDYIGTRTVPDELIA
jgi:DNA-binding transcriptional regulator GbsR (MarR family)